MFQFATFASMTYCIQPSIPLRVGFPIRTVCGSKLVCQLPAAFRRLQRPSSPVIAKASTTCTYSLDPIGLRTWTSSKSRIKHAAFSPPLSSLGTLSLRLVRRNHIVVPATEQLVDFYQIFKDKIRHSTLPWCLCARTGSLVLNSWLVPSWTF